jgi:HPt (histidine-containing phosphotransfer) domain-containing protein
MANAQAAREVQKACDPVAALARLGGDAELYREVLERFFDTSPASLAKIAAAIDRQNGEELHRAAHSYKGLAAMAGTEDVARTAAALDQLGRQGQLEAAAALLHRMRQELALARAELTPYFGEA